MSRSLSSLWLLAAALLTLGAQSSDEPKPVKKQSQAVKVLILSGVPLPGCNHRQSALAA